MANKVFRTIDEQLDILRSKGLVIENDVAAKGILFRENYFFLSGYRHLFMTDEKPKRFIPGSTFEEIYALFLFDRHFRNIMFKNLLIVENNIKSIFSYQLSKRYGYKEKDYLREENFTKDYKKSRQVKDLIKKMKRQIRVNGNQHSATMHYLNNYGYVPLWVLVKVLSFGIVSEFYSILDDIDQQEIANYYGVNPTTLMNYLPLLANYRNLCAHEDILYDHRTERVIADTKYHSALNIPKIEDEYIFGKNDIFAIMIILKDMLTQDEYRLFVNEVSYEISMLDGKVNSISLEKILNKMGIPMNYRDILEMR